MDAIQILAETRRLIFQGWTKGRLAVVCPTDPQAYCYCLEGACAVADGAQVVHENKTDPLTRPYLFFPHADENRKTGVMIVVPGQLSKQGQIAFNALEDVIGAAPQNYNDDIAQTKEDVIAKIDEAILKLTTPV